MSYEPTTPGMVRAHPSGWTQRVGALRALPELLRTFGVDPEPLLEEAGLSAGELSNPDAKVPYGAIGQLLAGAARATGQPHFGLLAGDRWHLADLGAIGEVLRNSASVGEALETLTVYQHLNSAGGMAFLARRGATVDFGYAIYYPAMQGADVMYDGVMVAACNCMREFAGASWTPTEVFLPHLRPAQVAPYRAAFRVQPRFDAEFCALRFPAYWMDKRIEGADPVRRRQMIDAIKTAGQVDLVQHVTRALRRLLLSGSSSGDELAGMLAMHRRTLNRRLREQGTTFQALLDGVRFEVARQLLAYSSLSLDDIAAAIGYAGVTAFMRTFRRWTGVTPGRWRRESLRAHAAWPAPPSHADASRDAALSAPPLQQSSPTAMRREPRAKRHAPHAGAPGNTRPAPRGRHGHDTAP